MSTKPALTRRKDVLRVRSAAAVAIVTAYFLGRQAERHNRPEDPAPAESMQEVVAPEADQAGAGVVPNSDVGKQRASNNKARVSGWFTSILDFLPPILIAASFSAHRNGYTHIAWIALLAANCSVCYILRPEDRRPHRVIVRLSAIVEAVVVIGFAASVLPRVIGDTYDPAKIVLGVAYAAIFVLAPSVLVVRWVLPPSFEEPVILACVTVVVGLLSFQGLTTLTRPLSTPPVNSAVLVFVGKTQEAVNLSVDASGDTQFPAPQSKNSGAGIDVTLNAVSNSSSVPLRNVPYAIMLIGGARLTYHLPLPANVRTRRFTADDSPITRVGDTTLGQLYSGILTSRHPSIEFGGATAGSFSNVSPSRAAVQLPQVEFADESEIDLQTQQLVDSVIQQPVTRPERRSIRVSSFVPVGGTIQVSNVVPPAEPDKLSWQTKDAIFPSYSVFDQRADDQVRNALFAIAILLGVAGASFINGLQTAMRRLSGSSS